MRGLFITGTGTGVGKTVVAAGILRRLIKNGIHAAPMKPIQTGCVPGMAAESGSEEGLRIPDLEFSLGAASLMPKAEEMELMCPFRYVPAVSPHLAGRLAGSMPNLEIIETAAMKLAAKYEALIVEGPGGVFVPINENEKVIDMIARLNLPVVVVAAAVLGTINHTLLTIGALRDAGSNIVGVIYNDFQKSDDDDEETAMIRKDNPKIIEHFSRVPTLGGIAYMDGIGGETASSLPSWDEFDAAIIGWDKIVAAVSGVSA